MYKHYLFDGSKKLELKKEATDDFKYVKDRKDAEELMAKNLKTINDLQLKLYAEKKEGVIFLFQAMDAAGKDGTIRAVLSCLSPHGVWISVFLV